MAPHQEPVSRSAVLELAHRNELWVKDPNLVKLVFWITICFLSSFAAGYDGSLFTGLLTVGRWYVDMGATSQDLVGLMGMTGVLGLGAGPWLGGWLGDKYGRPRAISVSSAIMILGGGLCTVYLPGNSLHQRVVWAVARVIISFASGATVAVAPALISEIAYPTQRANMTALFWCGFYLGSVSAAWVVFGTNQWTSSWAWRLPCLLQVSASVIQLPFSFFLPESPRYLVAHEREQEAAAILAKYHARGDVQHPLVLAQMAEIISALNLDAHAKDTNIWDLFKGEGNRRRLWILVVVGFCTQWVGNGVVTYYIAQILSTVGITNTRHQAAFNGGIQVFNLIVATLAASQVERFGRRKLFLTSGFGMLICFIFITASSAQYAKTQNPGEGRAVIAFLFLFDGFYDIALTPLAIAYPIEILPYRFRTRGTAIVLTIISLALTFNIWANPVALAAIHWKLYIVYIGVICFFIANVWFCFPETRGQSAEALEALFDGAMAEVAFTDPEKSNLEKNRAGEHVEEVGE